MTMRPENASAVRGFCNFVSLVILCALAIWWAPGHVNNPDCTSHCIYTTNPDKDNQP